MVSQAATLQVEAERLQARVLKGKGGAVDIEGMTGLANATQRILQQLGATRRQSRVRPALRGPLEHFAQKTGAGPSQKSVDELAEADGP